MDFSLCNPPHVLLVTWCPFCPWPFFHMPFFPTLLFGVLMVPRRIPGQIGSVLTAQRTSGCSVTSLPDGVLTTHYHPGCSMPCRGGCLTSRIDTLLATRILLALCDLLSTRHPPCRSSPFWLFDTSLTTHDHE